MLSTAVAAPMTSAATHPRPAPGLARIAVVVVGLDSIAQAETARLELATRHQLERSAKFEPLPMGEALDPGSVAQRHSREQEADAALKLGIQAYNDLDTQKALFQLDRAMKAYEQTDFSGGMNAYVRAWTMKIASQVANGENKAANREVEKLLAVAPRAEFAPSFFPPELIAHAERTRKAALSGTGRLQITTRPTSAEIYVDGEFRGTSPVSVSRLAPGEHFVTARATGYLLLQERTHEGAAEFTLRPSEGLAHYQTAVRKISAQPKGKERDAAAVELGAALHVDQVLVVIASKSIAGSKLDVTALRIATADGHNWGFRNGTVSLGDALIPQWDIFTVPVLAKDTPRDGGPVTHFDNAFVWNQRATGVTLLAAGVVLLGSGVYCGVTSANLNNQYRATPVTDPNSARLRSTSQTYGFLTDVFVLAGLGAAATGGYFAFLAPGSKSAEREKPASDLPMPPPPALAKPVNKAPAPAPVTAPPASPRPTPTTSVAPASPTPPPAAAPDRGKKPPKNEEDDLKNF